MKKLKIFLSVVAVILIVLFSLYKYYLSSPDAEHPKLTSEVKSGTIMVGEMERNYLFYAPSGISKNAPLLVIMHGSTQKPKDIRKYTAYEFERLADTKGFIVVYPEGFKKNWNDCRKSATYPAKVQHIDDKGLIVALIDRFSKEYGIDTKRVFAAGYSNGGHMAFKLALEMPDRIAGIASVSANFPTADNTDCIDCRSKCVKIPVLIMNGTLDPLNPYNGGKVGGFLGSRGTALSSRDTANFFATRAGYAVKSSKTETINSISEKGRPVVNVELWKKAGLPEIRLYSVINGGHNFPQAKYRAPRLLGPTVKDFNGPEEIWNFFSGIN